MRDFSPLLYHNPRVKRSCVVHASGAATAGHGTRAKQLPETEVCRVGRQTEIWKHRAEETANESSRATLLALGERRLAGRSWLQRIPVHLCLG